jgi:hypothetical protein
LTPRNPFRSRLVWFPEAAGAEGYAVPFVRIILHAVSRDTSAECARPCILAQVDGAAPGGAAGGEAAEEEEEGDDEEEEEEEVCTQLRLVPADDAARAFPPSADPHSRNPRVFNRPRAASC